MNYWSGKVAIVTGASSGLGLALAAELAKAGARVVLAARGAEALNAVADKLRALGGEVLAVSTDVTNDTAVESCIASTIDTFGQIDLLANCAGRSARRAVLDTSPNDFREMLELNLLAMVRTTRAAAPHLLRSRGHLVNIGSLAGKAASRYLGAYPTSKFAVTGYTQQLRLELEPLGLHVLLVCPGPIQRDDSGVRYDLDAANLPESARRPGGGVKLRGIPPATLAIAILRACQRRRAELVVPGVARWLFALQQLWPALGDWIVRKKT